MGLFKGLLIGSAAAAVMATGSAFAADLPSRKAAPVAYVKICDVYGRGFYYIPGTNTCLKVGGRVRFELAYHRAQNAWVQGRTQSAAINDLLNTPNVGFVGNVLSAVAGGTFNSAARQDTLGWRSRAYVNMDARTQTAWGTVQTVLSIQIRTRSGAFTAGGGFTPGGNLNNVVNLGAAYIRFAGFTMGRAPWILPSNVGYMFYSTFHAGSSPNGMLQLSYTAVFGGGFSATVGIVDKDDFGLQRGGNAAGGTFTNVIVDSIVPVTALANTTGASTSPNRIPNFVLSLRLDQGWGFVHVGGAIGENQSVLGNRPNRKVQKTGWAILGSARINLPSLARGDFVQFYVGYSDGLINMVVGDTANGSIAKDGRRMGGYVPTYTNYNRFVCGSALGVARDCIQNTKALVASAAFRHYWTPSLRSMFGVSYMKITPAKLRRMLTGSFSVVSRFRPAGQLLPA